MRWDKEMEEGYKRSSDTNDDGEVFQDENDYETGKYEDFNHDYDDDDDFFDEFLDLED